jgi:hypothetical protein
LGSTPVLLVLISLLPSRARPEEHAADLGEQPVALESAI